MNQPACILRYKTADCMRVLNDEGLRDDECVACVAMNDRYFKENGRLICSICFGFDLFYVSQPKSCFSCREYKNHAMNNRCSIEKCDIDYIHEQALNMGIDAVNHNECIYASGCGHAGECHMHNDKYCSYRRIRFKDGIGMPSDMRDKIKKYIDS